MNSMPDEMKPPSIPAPDAAPAPGPEPACAGDGVPAPAAAEGQAAPEGAPPQAEPEESGWQKLKSAAGGARRKHKEELQAVQDRLLRLQADFDNFRKRTQRERAELTLQANEDLMKALLPVVDHLELALRAAESHHAGSAVVEGFRLVGEQLLATLRRYGLSDIAAERAAFDPHRHEAIAHLPSAEVPEGQVMVVSRRGFLLGERVLRAAQVVVSSGAPEGAAPPPAGA